MVGLTAGSTGDVVSVVGAGAGAVGEGVLGVLCLCNWSLGLPRLSRFPNRRFSILDAFLRQLLLDELVALTGQVVAFGVFQVWVVVEAEVEVLPPDFFGDVDEVVVVEEVGTVDPDGTGVGFLDVQVVVHLLP
jgi:hypothetical protein